MDIFQASPELIEPFSRVVPDHVQRGMREAFGLTPLQAMQDGLRQSSHAYAAYSNGLPICMWGVAPQSLLGGVGVLWVIPTCYVCRYRVGFVRASKHVLGKMLKDYRTLLCWIHESEFEEMRWMQWLGYQFADTGNRPLLLASVER